MIIITSVDAVYKNFGKPDQEPLRELTLERAVEMLANGEFPPGSMGSKIEAAVSFVQATGHDVIITSPKDVLLAVEGKAGTRLSKGT